MYLYASQNDPGYVKTNHFKVETENSVVNFTQETQRNRKRRRVKVTRPPSTILEELERENQMQDREFPYKKDKKLKYQEGNNDEFEINKEYKSDNQETNKVINEVNDEYLQSNQDEEDDFESENKVYEIQDVQPITSQLIHKSMNNDQENHDKEIQNNSKEEDEESNISQFAQEFFMQTQGDRGGSFDLLATKMNDKQDSDEINQYENQKLKVKSPIKKRQNLIKPNTSLLEYHHKKRFNTDFEIYQMNYQPILSNDENNSPKKTQRINVSPKKQCQDNIRENQKQGRDNNIQNTQNDIKDSVNKTATLETDGPNLAAKLKQQPKVKLFHNLLYASTNSSFKSPTNKFQFKSRLNENQVYTGHLPPKVQSDFEIRQSAKSSLSGNIPQQTGDENFVINIRHISSDKKSHQNNQYQQSKTKRISFHKLSPKRMPSLFTFHDEDDDNQDYIVQVLNTRQMRLQQQQHSQRIQSSTQNHMNNEKAGRISVEYRYCTVCSIEQPLRSKHCRKCGRCISTYDHHCPWIGNCVGERNKKYFYTYLWFQEIQLILGLLIALKLIKEDIQVTYGITVLVICSLFLLFVTNLLIFHTYIAFQNLTTWEFLSWNKISYLQVWPKKLGSPFNIGWKENLKLYFCYNLKADNYLVWRMPKRRPDLVGNSGCLNNQV